MRSRVMLVLVFGLLGSVVAAPFALADGPSGSSEEVCVDEAGNTSPADKGSCDEGETLVFTNEVDCEEEGDPLDTPVGNVFVGVPDPTSGLPEDFDLGVELCADDDHASPVDGRVIVGVGGGKLTNPDPLNTPIGVAVIADGDETNGGIAEQATGWARVDLNTRDGLVIRCGDAEGNQDATHPTPQLPDQDNAGPGNDGPDDCG